MSTDSVAPTSTGPRWRPTWSAAAGWWPSTCSVTGTPRRPDGPPDVDGHVDLLAGFAAEVSDRPVILMGNSLGGLVAALAASAAPDRVAGLILIDPALPTERLGMVHPRVLTNFVVCSVPGVGERYLTARRSRTTAERTVRRVLSATCVDPGRVPADVVDAHVALTAAVDRHRRRPRLPGLGPVAVVGDGPLGSDASPGSTPSTSRSSHLHGSRDMLVPLAAARRMAEGRTNWRLEVARDIGHAPDARDPGVDGAADRRVAGPATARAAWARAGGSVDRRCRRSVARQLTWRSRPSQ